MVLDATRGWNVDCLRYAFLHGDHMTTVDKISSLC